MVTSLNVYKCFLGYVWEKVFSHDTTVGYFPTLLDTLHYNVDDPDAPLYSILDQIESYRKDGVFHIRLCYPEYTDLEFPCNEWTQSSNFVEEAVITDFHPIKLTWRMPGDNNQIGTFAGLGRNEIVWGSLIDDTPQADYWYHAIGSTSRYERGVPGPMAIVLKTEVFVARPREGLSLGK